MKRTTKGKKVLQAITIGLTAMITATSSPVITFAEEENNELNNEFNNNNNENEGNNENQQQDPPSISEVAGECANIINEQNNQISEGVEAINDASSAVENIVEISQEQNIEIPETIGEIQNDLQESVNDLSQAGSNLQAAVEAFNVALVADYNVEQAGDITNPISVVNQVNIAEQQVAEFNNFDASTTNTSNFVIEQATVANTSDSREEAYAAKDTAVKELGNAEQGFKKAEAAYNLASAAVNEAEKKYNEALEEQKKAEDKLNEAKENLNNANINATAANEMLKAAQAKLDKLDAEAIRLAEVKEDLQAIQNQYYKLMVHFYRDNKINSAVYNTDGSLNIKESAIKAENDGKLQDTSATENTYKLGRELMKDLVIYKLEANGATDIKFAIEEDGLALKESADGKLTTDNKGNDKVIIEGTQNQYWDYTNGNSGRQHNVKVTYKIKNEDGSTSTITEHYNYILKADLYGDTSDIANGPIYLAQVNPETGEVIRDTDPNNMDDYIKLGEEINKAIDAAKIVDEYNVAKKAVDDAQSLIDNINKTIDKLSKEDLEINKTRVETLKKELDDAKDILKIATKDKEALEDKVEEARKAVAAIDLSRFDTQDINPIAPFNGDSSDSDSDSDTTSDSSETTSGYVPGEMLSPTGSEVSSSTSGTVSLSAGRGSSLTYIANNEQIKTGNQNDNNQDQEQGVTGVRTEKTEDNKIDKGTKIDDNIVPLIDLPSTLQKDHSIFWWITIGWLLLLLLLITYLTKKYVDKRKEKEETKKNEQ